MKKIISICVAFIAFLWIVMFIASCTPVKYVMVDPKDSSKLVEVRKRIIYDDYYDYHMPLYFNYGYYRPFYNPLIIQAPIRVPQRYIAPRALRGRH